MDENEVGGGGAGYGGDPGEQFHRNEAISAVADDGFLGEEDDDYEDLYNDVNVGENFLQSLRRNEDNIGQRNEEVQDDKPNVTQPPPPPPQPQPQPQPQPLVEGGGVELPDEGASSGVPGRVEGYQNMGFRGNSNVSDVGLGGGAGGPVAAAAGGGFRVELEQSSNKIADLEERAVNSNIPNNQQMVHHPPPHAANIATYENSRNVGNVNGTGGNVYGANGVGGGPVGGSDGVVIGGSGGGSGGGTILFVGDLHWWTTDAELEVELCKYGPVKEVKFFDERASGKSKGYCQVEFFDPTAATACKEGMNGHVFNGRPCVVAYASPYTVKRMGEAQVNRNQQQTAGTAVNQPRRGPADLPIKPGGAPSNIPTGASHLGGGAGDSNGRGGGFARGNWGRGNPQGGMNRGYVGPMRNRGGGMSGRGMAGNGFGPGVGGAPPMMHPQAMMGQGFDPAFAGHMGRMGSYGFPGAPTAPFPGILSSFGPVGNVGLPGVAPHVNPAFFGRGMPLGGMGMGPAPGVEGPNMGMWSDPNMGQWGGDDHGGRAGESSYGEEAASDHQYGEGSQERGQWPNAMKDKERGSERDWSGSSERRYRDDRGSGYERDAPREKDVGQDHEWAERRHRDDKDTGRDRQKDRDKERERSVDHERGGGRERERERHRDDRDRYADHHRHRNREADYDDDWDRGRSSRSHGKSRVSHEEEHRSRSRDADYGKRRRLTSE